MNHDLSKEDVPVSASFAKLDGHNHFSEALLLRRETATCPGSV